MQRAIVFNGKFLRARPTGVHRVAGELIRHVDQLLVRDGAATGYSWSLLSPKDAHEPLALSAIERKAAGISTWQIWEQLELPRLARGAVLVNLCNLAPLTYSRSLTMIHDAQVFLSPKSYSPAFAAWYRFALPRIGRSAARIVTVSEYSRDRLEEFGVAPRDKISVIHNGIDHLDHVVADPAVLTRLALEPRTFVVVTAGAQKHKNVAVLFEAFKSPSLSHLTLVVVGADNEQAFREQDATPPPGTIFAGRVSDGELRALYEQAACMVFPSTTEGFGLPPLEAMRLGCPVIVAPCGALPEVCGDAATYAHPNDPAAWVSGILSLAEEGEMRRQSQARGRERAARYRWEDAGRKLLGLIVGVASKAESPC
jgi:glycosyltransferase involved in cell wall biosynthesis